MSTVDPLTAFSTATRTWFTESFTEPTPVQVEAWRAIARGEHALVIAPTGSGKTLAAFLWALDRLFTARTPPTTLPPATVSPRDAAPPAHAIPERAATRILYLSPLKALGVDVERNLKAPLAGIARTAQRLSLTVPSVRVGVRSGDTPANERRTLVAQPPDILITTPESLYLMLTSGARSALTSIDTVIVDEIHSVAGSKRGAHLAVSLERLDAVLARPAQRIGLSATVRPAEEVARFLTGGRPASIVAPPTEKRYDLTVRVPVEDLSDLASENAEGSIWPHVEEAMLTEVLAHRSTIIFTNSRRLAEKLTGRLNELWTERLTTDPEAPPPAEPPSTPPVAVIARAHHGSVSKQERADVEHALKTGQLRCVVATSSLELGIDMGAVDLVLQVESPPSVAAGLQRLGRAGHGVGAVSRGILYPKHRADLLHTAVVAEYMRAGTLEALRIPTNPLDVLAQHTVSAAAMEPLDVEEWFDCVRRAAPFAALPRAAYLATLDLLAGRYPSDRFGELRPRIVWDRTADTLTARPGAQRLAVTNGGTIPDRGMFTVVLAGESDTGRRVGELDEEMVYESRVGDVIALGASSWLIQDITFDRVVVSPAAGQPGRLPFWIGDAIGRSAELGRAIGEVTGALARMDTNAALNRARTAGLDERAATNLVAFIREQAGATRVVPDADTLVVERFRDELGDWRVVIHSPYGMRVHGPWALAMGARIRAQLGIDAQPFAADDGIVLRLPDTDDAPPGAELLAFDADELHDLVTAQIGGSALFASRFRECAARALILPKLHPGRRAPLWQQRQRASQLLDVARDYPEFPMVLEAVRECLQDVYDLPALNILVARITRREVRVVEVTTPVASPFAKSLLFGYIGTFMYEGDAPLAERRAAALSLDPALLADLLGTEALRDLLDPAVLAAVEDELQRRTPDRRRHSTEGLADLLRELGPLTEAEAARRLTDIDLPTAVAALEAARRIARVQFAQRSWLVAVEDLSRLRDALGVPTPLGMPSALAEPVRDPLGDLVSRYARTHGPFRADAVAARFGVGVAVALAHLTRLRDEGRLVVGTFRVDAPVLDAAVSGVAALDASTGATIPGLRADPAPAPPGPAAQDWCDPGVLRRIRIRCLAALRADVEPVDPVAYARYLPAWQHVIPANAAPIPPRETAATLHGPDGVLAVLDQLEGVRIPASAWESFVLPARVTDYQPGFLDELTAAGEVIWVGSGALGSDDGWVSFHRPDAAPLTLPPPEQPPLGDLERDLLAVLDGGGGYFLRQLTDALPDVPGPTLRDALWSLVWAGVVTNDTFAPVRGLARSRATHRVTAPAPRARMALRPSRRVVVRSAPPADTVGRWSAVPTPSGDVNRRALALAESLLDRYGLVTRGAVMAEGVAGGFALIYRTLTGFEESGRARRGYFVAGLGGAQFALPPAVDRLRLDTAADPSEAFALAATDPANPFGAALDWPPPMGAGPHRPARKAGAFVVLVAGRCVLYLERGAKTVLTFSAVPDNLARATEALVAVLRRGRAARIRITTVDGLPVEQSPLSAPLRAAGFRETPQGLRLDAA